MSNIQLFKNKENLTMIWDILLDELHINTTNKTSVSNIRTIFESNLNLFIARINPQSKLIELNKQFLSQVLIAVNKLFPKKQEQSIKRIHISDEEVLEPYKIEDIHASRQTEFEKELERKRMEMENYMTPQKPKELDFSDKNLDGKIKAMDSLVADKLAQRNFEIEQLQNNDYNTTNINLEHWLTPKETSVKNEKTIVDVIEQKSIIKNNQNSRLKHMSIDSNNNITLSIEENNNSLKKVSWDDQIDKENTFNIFNKLKKQPLQNIDTSSIDDKQYIEQKSMPLPEIKQEEIIRNQSTLITPNNEPIIPKTEIIKQLNEMNIKIDNLYNMIYKLTTIIEKNNENNNICTLEDLKCHL